VKREKTDWGVRLTVHPFDGLPVNSEMFIRAEVRGSEIKLFFSGTTVQRPLKRPDALIWIEQMRAVFDAAQAESRR
jgi:hypothetical protein